MKSRRAPIRLCLPLLAVLGAAGCDEGGLFGGRNDVGEELRSLGVVTFSHATAYDVGGRFGERAARFAVEARFVRFAAPYEGEVREVLGLADLDALPPVDACASVSADPSPQDRGAPPAAVGSGIELLDVGRVLLRSAAREQPLAVRTFPDLLDLMSGVTYGGAASLPFDPGRSYELRGETDRSPWVTVVAPPDWDDLLVNGIPLAESPAGTLDGEGRLRLEWTPWAQRASDLLVTLAWTAEPSGRRGVVCRPEDDGAFELPLDALRLLPAAPDVADLTLRVERIDRVSFLLDRVQEAEALFRVSATVPLR